MKEMEEMVRGIIISHLESDLTEENGWSKQDIAYLERMVHEDFTIQFDEKAKM